jgi:hypothetical protein
MPVESKTPWQHYCMRVWSMEPEMMEDREQELTAEDVRKENRWTQYRRTSVIELRLCERSDDHGKVGVDYIARDPANPEYEWPMTAEDVRRDFKRI